jgi:hypothetical protein
MWLPDDLMIVDGVKSGEVRSLVLRIIEEFYEGTAQLSRVDIPREATVYDA